jgi:sugar/nucleoside kinase (ribokinase family)
MSEALLVVGSVAYDDVATNNGERKDLLGGSATYFSVAASLFKAPRLVGVVGRDFADHDRAILTRHGVDTAGLEVDPTGDTFRWGGRYHADMNQRTTLYTHLNVFERFRPAVPASWLGSEFVFLGNIDPELQLDVLMKMHGPKFVTMDTMNFWIDGKRDAVLKVLSRVQGILLNDEEGALLTGGRTALAVGRGVQKLGPNTVVLKRGEHGALLFHGPDIFYVPAYPLEVVVDPTGAGDTFAGGVMGYLARTGDLTMDNLRRAMLTGSIMASFCVEGFGLDTVVDIGLDDVRRRYSDFEALTRCPSLHL